MTATPPRPGPTTDNPAGRFFGALLMVVGALIALLSGLCTLAFGAMILAEPGGNGGAIGGGITMLSIFGGVPFLFGLALIFVGRGLYRAVRRPPPSVAKTFE